MGIWGKLSSLWSGEPKAPAPLPYNEDVFARTAGQRGSEMGSLTQQQLKDWYKTPIGLSAAEKQAITYQPAQVQSRAAGRTARQMNRGAAFSGKYGGGGQMRDYGRLRSEAARNAADIVSRGEAFAANFARQDRLNRIQAGESYALPRLALYQQEQGRQGGYTNSLNLQEIAKWKATLDQYNRNFDWAWGEVNRGADWIASMSAGGGGGGGGMPM